MKNWYQVLGALVGVLGLTSCPGGSVPGGGGGGSGGLSGTWQGNAQFEGRFIPARYLIKDTNGTLTGDVQDCNETFTQCQTVGNLGGKRDQSAVNFEVKVNNQVALSFAGTTDSTKTIMDGTVTDPQGNGTMRLDKK
jgi:hypothetical protein